MSQSKKKKQKASQKASRPKSAAASPKVNNSNQWIWIAAILVIGFIAFSPVLQADFINYDDDYYVTDNRMITHFDAAGAKTIFTTFYGNQYSPVAMTILALEIKLFGAEPGPLKFISILLHLANALLVFFFVKKLFSRLDFAVIAAGLFAVHTLQVESVAWMAASMKVSTYALFSLASMLVYLSFLEKRKWGQLILSLVLFILSCMCKEQAVVLPILLVAIDYLKRRNLLSREVILEKLPFFAVSLIFGLATMTVADEMRGTGEALPYSVVERTLFACYALTAYTLKHILPVDLSTYYLYPPVGQTPAVYYLTPLFCLAMLGAFVYAWKKDQRLIVFGLAFFLVNIALTILSQIFSVRDVMMADRYVYLSTIGFFLILASWIAKVVEKRPSNRTFIYGVLILYGLALTALTYQRSGVWKNSITVFTDAIEKGKPKEGRKYSPAIALPFTNRGLAKKNQGDVDGAMADYDLAITANPGHGKAYLNRGNIYFNAGKHQQAIENHNKAIELEPSNQKAYSSRGAAYASLGQYEQALKDFDKAIELDPNFLDALRNRALIRFTVKDYEGALPDLDQVLKLNPKDADVLNFKGQTLQQLKRFPEAEAFINQSIQLAPQNGTYYLTRAYLYRDLGDKARARQDANQAQALGVKVDPGFMSSLNF